MLNKQKLYGAIGFAMKAGKCEAGSFACERAVKAKKAKLVLLDKDASQRTREQWQGTCGREGIGMLIIEGMGRAIGKDGRMTAVITDNEFADMIKKAYDAIETDVLNVGGVD